MIHISTLTTAETDFPLKSSLFCTNYLQHNDFLSHETHIFFGGKSKLFSILICHWYPLSNLLFTKGFSFAFFSSFLNRTAADSRIFLLLVEKSVSRLFPSTNFIRDAICARHSLADNLTTTENVMRNFAECQEGIKTNFCAVDPRSFLYKTRDIFADMSFFLLYNFYVCSMMPNNHTTGNEWKCFTLLPYPPTPLNFHAWLFYSILFLRTTSDTGSEDWREEKKQRSAVRCKWYLSNL